MRVAVKIIKERLIHYFAYLLFTVPVIPFSQAWHTDYAALRSQWQSIRPGSRQESHNARWRDRRCRVDKDVRRTDRGHPFFAKEGGTGLRALRNVLLTYLVYNDDLGYCQVGGCVLAVNTHVGLGVWVGVRRAADVPGVQRRPGLLPGGGVGVY